MAKVLKGSTAATIRSEKALSKFFDALKEGLNSNKYYKVEKVKKDYHLYFSKKILGQTGITKSILRFKKK